eukprot:GCRY01004322.1.p1 GENE.GCRY01004322.1~~GCRY01004322.1.p1  ORF type:complete len:184 (+),score=21.58 GCRY01004322.1:188-739(+)
MMGLTLLIFNCGSSSIGFKVFQILECKTKSTLLVKGKAHRVEVTGLEKPFIEATFFDSEKNVRISFEPNTYASAATEIMQLVASRNVAVDLVSHRFVHGGNLFSQACEIKDGVLAQLKSCIHFAPLHNKVACIVIDVCISVLLFSVLFALSRFLSFSCVCTYVRGRNLLRHLLHTDETVKQPH